MSRSVYLISYDICDPLRLARVHRYLIGFKVGGQKSVYECWLTAAEFAMVRSDLESLIEPAEDRVHFFQLDPRMQMSGFGRAVPFSPGAFFVI